MDGRLFMMTENGFRPIETSDEFEETQSQDGRDNIRANCARGLPFLKWEKQPRMETLCIVAGGPSLLQTFPLLEKRIAEGAKIFAVNDTHDWLIRRGIVPDYMGCIEVAPWPRGKFCQLPNDHTEYLLADVGHPTIIDHVLGKNITIYHPYCGIGEEKIINEYDKHREDEASGLGALLVAGGESITVRALNLTWLKGFRHWEMFGFDGSFQDNMPSHAYFDEKHKWPIVNFFCAGRSFRSTYYLARQVDDLRRVLIWNPSLRNLKIHGDGMAAHMHRHLYPDNYDQQEQAA
ncbi:MAG: DUF115 domain-containing protein [Gemmatimonadaceae bacterium]|nr:DUF115 domain-containing protein [Gemmatimonadaceae bacterium]